MQLKPICGVPAIVCLSLPAEPPIASRDAVKEPPSWVQEPPQRGQYREVLADLAQCVPIGTPLTEPLNDTAVSRSFRSRSAVRDCTRFGLKRSQKGVNGRVPTDANLTWFLVVITIKLVVIDFFNRFEGGDELHQVVEQRRLTQKCLGDSGTDRFVGVSAQLGDQRLQRLGQVVECDDGAGIDARCCDRKRSLNARPDLLDSLRIISREDAGMIAKIFPEEIDLKIEKVLEPLALCVNGCRYERG